eukprot:CAMPEP_0203851946 /NCGR_PEP_ID=MMETSP0359-20131031/7635_1 /ASSEMBLY_ACC=CAM_ASM_000338 /TAXON_ID=268821 /ORGANISM="Scrippsiella Hangoei, Strain SHTV-5" /LENGTH=343 /DNA_ID=CAMNT_0050768017 /DNA_START=90 /DNA_END=1121 /DNA_ORIENTATION=+
MVLLHAPRKVALPQCATSSSSDAETPEMRSEAWIRQVSSCSGCSSTETPDMMKSEVQLRGLWTCQVSSRSGCSGIETPDMMKSEVMLRGLPKGSDSAPDTPPFSAYRCPFDTPCEVPLEALASKLMQLDENHLVAKDKSKVPRPPPAAPPGLGGPFQPSPGFAHPRMAGLQTARDPQPAVSPPPPPPQPHPVSKHGARATGKETFVVSVGSLGHPGYCSEACPYVKRKTGCKMGSKCPKCHLCFWQRPMVKELQQEQRRTKVSGRSPEMAGGDQAPPRTDGHFQGFTVPNFDVALDVGLPSVGSICHPHACGKPCKYESKGKRCKDGRWCVRCHLCVWRRIHG